MTLKLSFLTMFFIAILGYADRALAMGVRLDTASAKAILGALQNPELARPDALGIAALPGNQGLIRKAISYHIPATTEAFADALVASAHGAALDTPMAKYLGFDRLKLNTGALTALMARIETHPKDFESWVVERVGLFSPADAAVNIDGYLVVGGTSGGFAFGEPKFYLNLNYFSEFDPAKMVLAHELYHAVQAVYSVDSDDKWLKPESPTAAGRAHQQMCANLSNLFSNLYQEGTASYVGDPLLIGVETGPLARKTREEFQNSLNNLGAHVTLLELSVVGLEASKPVPYDDVYALGFYVPEPLYGVGYVMAKAIATDEGAQALAGFLKRPGYAFTQHYMMLPRYGQDREHPKLGPHTAEAVQLLASGCPLQ